MAADEVNLPEGYSLDQPAQGLPEGYTLDAPDKSFSGFMRNAGSDVSNLASGVGSLAKGLVTHPIDTTENLVKNIVPATYNEYKTAITHPIEHTYAHPVNTLLDALPLASGALKAGQAAGLIGEAGEGAEAATTAAKTAEEGSVAVPTSAPPIVTPADRVANSAFIQGMGSTPRKVLSDIGMGSGKNLEQKVMALRKWSSTADSGENAARYLDKSGEFAERIQDVHDTAGSTLGDILKKVSGGESANGETVGMPAINKKAVIDDLQNFADNTADTATEGSINKLIKTADKLEGKPITDLKTIQQIKQMAGDQLKKDPSMAKVYGYLSDKINDVVEKYGEAVGDPTLKSAYDTAKINYANSSKILPMLGLAQAKGMVLPHGVIRNIAEKMFELSTGNTPGQLYKNALLKGSSNIAPISAATSKIPSGLSSAAYAGLADELAKKYGNNQ